MTDLIELYNGLTELKIRGGHEWYRIDDRDAEEATVEIYDEIGHWGVTAKNFTRDLGKLSDSTKAINLRINSPGGSVFQGLTIASRLREHPAKVNVTVDGVAASIASVIAMAGDTIKMAQGAQMMIHNPSGVVLGGSAEMRKMGDLLDKIARDSIASAYQARAGGDVQDWLDRMAAETWYSADEAVAIGLADTAEGAQDEDSLAEWEKDLLGRHPHELTAYGFRYPGREAAPDPSAADRARRSRAAVARVRGLREESK